MSVSAMVHASAALSPSRRALALTLMTASGFAGLGYEIVWTQQSALWLGHESAAVFAVVAAFFGGVSLGALLLGSRISRSARPARWYAGCEIAIGVWGLALAALFSPVTNALLGMIGPQPSVMWHWSVAFCGIFLLLLPATAAMGATLPAMERIVSRMQADGAAVAPLYAANTFGAVLGVLATAFWLVPELGLLRTVAVCVSLNLLCAAAALRLSEDVGEVAAFPDGRGAVLLSLLGATGLLGIGYEVLVVRALSQVAENTVYTFAILLAVYLIGTAAGAAAYARWRAIAPGRSGLLRLLAVSCMIGITALAAAQSLKESVLDWLGPGMVPALLAEATLAAVSFLLPSLVMGALFSHLCTEAKASGISLGRAIGVNTLGAAAAPMVFGVLLMAGLELRLTLLLVAVGYLALCSWRSWTMPLQWVAGIAAVALVIWLPSLAVVDVPEGGRLVSHVEGATDVVSIVEDANGIASLHINNRQQEGSTATLFADARQALLPILLHPAPRRALFLGLGTGVTARSAADDPQLQVDAVELLPEVIDASAYFTRSVFGDAAKSNLRLMSADARRFVRATTERYDVIVADNFHPARSGSGSLYTVEHFAAIRERLAADGVFCQWLPLHQLDLQTLRSIVRAFITAYPHGYAILATNSLETPVVGLVGRRDDRGFSIAQIRDRLVSISTARAPAALDIDDDLALLGSFIAGPASLARFAGNAPVNTDDRPVVAYRAPRITYAPDSLPRDRLNALLGEMDITPQELLAEKADDVWSSRLVAYWAARDLFIAAGRHVQPTSDVQRMLAQVREPLLEVLHISPDFRPAYDPLLLMATTLGRTDAAAARTLLIQLNEAQPARPEAMQVLSDLGVTELR